MRAPYEMNQNPNTAAVIGAGSLDGVLPMGVHLGLGPRPFTGGGKETLDASYRPMAETIIGRPNVQTFAGGNGVNSGTVLAVEAGYDVTMTGVRGADNPASNAIGEHLKAAGIIDAMKVVDGYQPSVAWVERYTKDRHIFGITRDSMIEHVTEGYLRSAIPAATRLVLIASLKKPELNQAAFAAAPEDANISVNFGSEEFDKHPDEIMALLEAHNPFLTAKNEEEIAKLAPFLGLSPETNPRVIAEALSRRHAQHVLCTLGAAGLVIASNGDSVFVPSAKPDRIEDTTSAGDHAHALTAAGLLAGESPEVVGAKVAQRVAHAIGFLGANGHLKQTLAGRF